MTEDEIKANLIFSGYRTLNASGLQAKTKYVALVGGVHYDAEGVVVTTELKELRYNSGEAAQNDLTFDVQVTNIEHYSADIKIIPSDPTVEYYYYISYIDSPKKSMKPIDIANNAITEYIWYWHNYTELKHVDPVTGVTELPAYALDIAETEYYIVGSYS